MKRFFVKSVPALLLITYVAFMWHAWLAPNYDRLNRLNAREQELERELATNKEWSRQLIKWRQKMKEVGENLRLASQSLPDEPDLIGLMASFAREAANRDLVFSSFTPGPAEPKEFYVTTPIRARFTGRLNDLVGLITASLDFTQVAVFREFTLKKIPAGSNFTLDGHLETYHMAPERAKKGTRRKS